MKFGALETVPATEHPDLLAQPVAEALATILDSSLIRAAAIDPTLSDTAAFCARYDIPLEKAANCIVIEAKRGERRQLAACMILGNTRADVNGVVRKVLDARRASFAPMEEAVAATGMEYGAITPIGLPKEWPLLIDARVAAADRVIIGSGLRKSKLALPGAVLAKLPNAQVVEGISKQFHTVL